MSHPEGVHAELNGRDDKLWHLGVYGQCLKNWDMMNAAIKASRDELVLTQQADGALADALETSVDPWGKLYETNKHFARHLGLQLLREVDNAP